MSKERVTKTLRELGLSSLDEQVYVFLARTGHQKIREIALALNLSESKARRSLKDLQSISIVKASIEYPLEFAAVPFKEVIDLLKSRRNRRKPCSKLRMNFFIVGEK